MARPQLDNGYTKIANELLDALCGIRISGEATQVLFVILRKTYGYNKTKDQISLSQICGLSGLSKSCVCRAIRKLIDMRLIVVKKDNKKITTYSINKFYRQWIPCAKKITCAIKTIDVVNKDNKPLSIKTHTKDNVTKDNITKDNGAFVDFWNAYPIKKGKVAATKAFNRLIKEGVSPDVIVEGAKRYAQECNGRKDYVKYAQGWLNGRRWEDENGTAESAPSSTASPTLEELANRPGNEWMKDTPQKRREYHSGRKVRP